MKIQPDEITIAVTVYNRRDYICDAIQSALSQSVSVKVIVVEDCGPDPSLKSFILERFGNRIEYFRNETRRGVCGNWNACMEYCKTPWISILHDDDMLRPNFVQSMISLAGQTPDRKLYMSRVEFMDENGKIAPQPEDFAGAWREIDIQRFADECFVYFAGQLFSVADAQRLGGVHPNSVFTGDWDLWFRLALAGGAAQTREVLAVMRYFFSEARGTSKVERMGWKWALDNIQRKRNLHRLKLQRGIEIPFDRTKLLAKSPIPSRLLLNHAHGFSKRLLRYNAWLFTKSRPPHLGYRIFQTMANLFGPGSIQTSSKVWRRTKCKTH